MWAALPLSLLCRTNARVARSVKFVSYRYTGYTDNATGGGGGGGGMRKGNGTTNQMKPSYFFYLKSFHVWYWTDLKIIKITTVVNELRQNNKL